MTASDWFQKGYNSQEINELDNAILYYQKAIDIAPNNANAYSNMGFAYYKKRNYDKAIECLKQSARLGSINAQKFF